MRYCNYILIVDDYLVWLEKIRIALMLLFLGVVFAGQVPHNAVANVLFLMFIAYRLIVLICHIKHVFCATAYGCDFGVVQLDAEFGKCTANSG